MVLLPLFYKSGSPDMVPLRVLIKEKRCRAVYRTNPILTVLFSRIGMGVLREILLSLGEMEVGGALFSKEGLFLYENSLFSLVHWGGRVFREKRPFFSFLAGGGRKEKMLICLNHSKKSNPSWLKRLKEVKFSIKLSKGH